MQKNGIYILLALIAMTALGPEHWTISLLFTALVLMVWRYGGLRG